MSRHGFPAAPRFFPAAVFCGLSIVTFVLFVIPWAQRSEADSEIRPEERLRFLLQSIPSRSVPFLLRHRYLVIAVLFNLPGNALIGGGGGIGLVAGMSRLFSYPKYLFAVCLAITPVPILFLLRGA